MFIVQLADINQATINFSLLSPQIIAEADKLTCQRKTQFLVCRSILAHLLKQHYQIAKLPAIVIGQNSRPIFADKELPDFNISHSRHCVAVAIASEGKVGVDIELTRERTNYLAIAQTFFSDIENLWLNKQTNKLDSFWQLWTLKESALKLYAKGVWQMKSMNIDLDKAFISAPFGEHFYYQYHKVGDIHLSINSTKPITDLTIFPH